MTIVSPEPPNTAEEASSAILGTVEGKRSDESSNDQDESINQSPPPPINQHQVGQGLTRLLTTASFNRSFTQQVSIMLGILTIFMPVLGSFNTFMMSQFIVRFALWFIWITSLNVNTEISPYHTELITIIDRLSRGSLTNWFDRRPNLIASINALRFMFLDYCAFLFVYTVMQAIGFTVRKHLQ